MPLREPPSRTARARSSLNDKRRLSKFPPSLAERQDLAARSSFDPYEKHKKDPRAYGLPLYKGDHEDPSYCDEHAGFMPADMDRALPLLKRGIEAGLFGDTLKKDDPGLLWTVDDNGWIYEARITNPGHALYHAYPVLPNETIARKVLIRYADHVNANPHLLGSLQAARARY